MTNTATANIAAEVRAIESGRNCRIDFGRHCFLVKSESGERTYEITVGAIGTSLVMGCTCPAGVKGRQVPAGSLGCKHRALVARRLERSGLARFDGGSWVVTGTLLSEAVA